MFFKINFSDSSVFKKTRNGRCFWKIQFTSQDKAVGASSINDKIAAEKQLSSALNGFNIQVEAYPDLKASSNFMQLQEELSDIENKLAAVRRFFNSATK